MTNDPYTLSLRRSLLKVHRENARLRFKLDKNRAAFAEEQDARMCEDADGEPPNFCYDSQTLHMMKTASDNETERLKGEVIKQAIRVAELDKLHDDASRRMLSVTNELKRLLTLVGAKPSAWTEGEIKRILALAEGQQ